MNDAFNKIKEFFVSMEMYNGCWAICVQYRPKWMAYTSEDGRIKAAQDDEVPDMWWYCANDNSVTVDEIIDLINETVQTNLEAIKKVELFKSKASELKQLFSDEKLTYKKLQTLKFVFDDSKVNEATPKPKVEEKKKVATKKDMMAQVGAEIQEHNVFTSSANNTTENNEPETKVNKAGRRKRVVIEPKTVGTVRPSEMTQEEIDDLRG